MKQVIGSTHRREGRRGERLFQIIQCQECGAISYERRKTRVQAALQAECRSCKAIASIQRKQQVALERAQDKALMMPIDLQRNSTNVVVLILVLLMVYVVVIPNVHIKYGRT